MSNPAPIMPKEIWSLQHLGVAVNHGGKDVLPVQSKQQARNLHAIKQSLAAVCSRARNEISAAVGQAQGNGAARVEVLVPAQQVAGWSRPLAALRS